LFDAKDIKFKKKQGDCFKMFASCRAASQKFAPCSESNAQKKTVNFQLVVPNNNKKKKHLSHLW
jgi:hypothetical protein